MVIMLLLTSLLFFQFLKKFLLNNKCVRKFFQIFLQIRNFHAIMADCESDDGGTFKRMTRAQCNNVWHSVAAVHCAMCQKKYGDGHKFAAVCISLPGATDDQMIPTQDLYLVSTKSLQKVDLLNKRRSKNFTDIDKCKQVVPFMSASWIYNELQVYSLHDKKGKDHPDYGFSVVRRLREPGETHRVLVTAISQCLCVLRKEALAERLFGPFDSFDMGLTDSSVMTATDEPPLNQNIYFQREQSKIEYRRFMADQKQSEMEPKGKRRKEGIKMVPSNVSNKRKPLAPVESFCSSLLCSYSALENQ